MPADFRRHLVDGGWVKLVGKTQKNAGYCNSAQIRLNTQNGPMDNSA